MRTPNPALTLAIAAIVAVLAACSHVNRFDEGEADVETIDEVGSVRVSVISVAEWSDYVDSLVPGFALSGDQALARVVPDARLLDERRLLASRTEIQAGFPTLAPGADAGARPVEVPGTTEGLDTSGSAAEGRTAAGQGSVGDLARTDLKPVDPMLQYSAADALKQEVELLNRAVRDAAQRAGYVPYVVRLKVGLMPRRRNLPYDAYVNLSLFTPSILESIRQPQLRELDVPLVVPLLVTDSLEATLHSASLGRLVEIAAAIQGTTGTVALGLDQSFTKEDLIRALGRDLNSLFMVSRLSDNTVRLRLGANAQVSQNYAMVPRNHTLTLLALLPEDDAEPSRKMRFQARTEIVHVRTGVALARKSGPQEERDVASIAKRFELCQFEGEARHRSAECQKSLRERIDTAYFAVVDNEWKEFQAALLPMMPDREDMREMSQIWSELVNLTPGYYEDEVTFELPDPGEPSFPAGQLVALFDDTKRQTLARVVGGTRVRGSKLCAALHFHDGRRSKALLPTQVSVDPRGEEVSLSFASVEALGLADYATTAGRQIALQLAYAKKQGDRPDCWKDATTWDAAGAKQLATVYHATRPTPTPAGFSVAWQPGHVVASKGKGTLVFELEPSQGGGAAAKAVVQISKATVVGVSVGGAAATSPGQEFEIRLTGGRKTRVVVQLDNLVKGASVAVELSNEKKVKQGTHALEVRGA